MTRRDCHPVMLLYGTPLFIYGISLLPTIFAPLLFTTHYPSHTTHNCSYHPTMVLTQRDRFFEDTCGRGSNIRSDE